MSLKGDSTHPFFVLRVQKRAEGDLALPRERIGALLYPLKLGAVEFLLDLYSWKNLGAHRGEEKVCGKLIKVNVLNVKLSWLSLYRLSLVLAKLLKAIKLIRKVYQSYLNFIW